MRALFIRHKGLVSFKQLLNILAVSLLLMIVFCDKNPVDNDDLIFGTMTDIDGNVYKTIKIGNQEWMAENLRVTRYNDGSPILHVPDSAVWVNDTTGAYCYFNNKTNTDTIKKFGALYNWYVVNPENTPKIAPSGWHVPRYAEWTILEEYLVINGYNWDGTTTENKIAKSLATKTDWLSSTSPGAIGNDLTKNNRSGFSALPGGYRGNNGYFYYINCYGHWWCATENDVSRAFRRGLKNNEDGFYMSDADKSCGMSVRLVKD